MLILFKCKAICLYLFRILHAPGPRLDLIDLFELYFQKFWRSVLRPRSQMRECHIAINVLVFSCGIWIYKVKHDFKIPWELPRWQNKQSQAFISGHTIAVISQQLCARANFECAVFYNLLLLNHIFQRVPSPLPNPPLQALNSRQWKWKKSSQKNLTGVAQSVARRWCSADVIGPL